MKWKKLGKIFDPREHKLSNDCLEFAQSPQVLVCDDFLRIYFSTRKMDRYGKYLSHISFVDMNKSFSNILNISTRTVIELGKLGCFDEHGIFPLNILKGKNRILGFIGGWNRRKSVSVDTAVGLAVSHDNGLTFNRMGDGPVLSGSLNEPFLVGDPFVVNYNDVYHMWYIFGTKWIISSEEAPQRVYKIGHAASTDCVSWHRTGKQIIADKLNVNECQALPTVIKYNGKYHMYFCYRHAFGFRTDRLSSYRIGYAFSYDLMNWIRDDDNAGIAVSEAGWDSDMQCYPHVVLIDNKIYMLYNGNEFGRYGFGLAVLEND